MVRLCLTTTAGTPELGLYRGLSLKARRAGHTVDVFRGTMDELRRPSNWPILLLVSMQASNRSEFRPWWHPGRAEDHAIVLYGFRDDGKIDVGDPIAGRTTITEKELAGRWRGLGLRLRPASAN